MIITPRDKKAHLNLTLIEEHRKKNLKHLEINTLKNQYNSQFNNNNQHIFSQLIVSLETLMVK